LFEGSFKRTILLPEGTNPEAITAASHDGMLEVTIPKRPEVLPRKVSVDVQR
jgi:HSP20 family protein